MLTVDPTLNSPNAPEISNQSYKGYALRGRLYSILNSTNCLVLGPVVPYPYSGNDGAKFGVDELTLQPIAEISKSPL